MANLAKKNKIMKKKKKQKNQKRYSLPNKIKNQVVREVDDSNMSQLLVDFAQPLFEENGGTENVDEETFRMIIDIAKIAWNFALFPDSEREEQQAKILDNIPISDAKQSATFYKYFDRLVERKINHYSSFSRMITKSEIIAGYGRFTVNVVSVPTKVS